MKLAYLILAHKDPVHVGRLVRRLQHPGAAVFLHIDKKSPIGPFREALEGLDVTVLENRVKVYWAGFSGLRAIMKLVDASLRDSRNFTHFCLLSGSDYPIKSNQQIFEFLSREPKNFVSVAKNLSDTTHRNAVNGFHFKDVPWLNPKVPVENFTDRILCFVLNRTVWALRLHRARRKTPPGFDFYCGSTWWCLRREAVMYIRDFCRENPRIYNYNRFVHAPDEILIHSILMNARLDFLDIDAEQVAVSPASFSSPDHVYGVHYIDWRNKGSHPKVLTKGDFGSLRESAALFARKFDSLSSAALLDMIDANLLRDAQGLHGLQEVRPVHGRARAGRGGGAPTDRSGGRRTA